MKAARSVVPGPGRSGTGLRGRLALAVRAGRRSPKLIAGTAILSLFAFVTAFGPLLAPDNPSADSQQILSGPSLHHLLGTTYSGQDVLSELLTGTRTTILAAVVAALLAELISVAIGVTAGYLGGLPGEGLSAVANVVLVLPVLPLEIILAAYFPNLDWLGVALIIAITSWPFNARVLRAQTLSMRRRPFVDAARSAGEPNWRIIATVIVPNLRAVILTGLLFNLLFATLVQTSLAFLGIGNVTDWSWGTMFYWIENAQASLRGAWWWYVPPGLCIGLFGLGLGLVNLGLDEHLNPRLRRLRRPAAARRRARSLPIPAALAGDDRPEAGLASR